MDIKKVKELIKLVSEYGIEEVELAEKDQKLRIKNKTDGFSQASPPPLNVSNQQPKIVQDTQKPSVDKKESSEKGEESDIKDNQKYVRSPMIGTYYSASDPNKPDFVKVGDEIQKGQVICIIESMKLFNEVESEYAGKVVKILVENASPVEYDQPLLIIEC